MYTNINGPPIVYEPIVMPVSMVAREAALEKRHRRDGHPPGKRVKKRRRKIEEEETILFETYLGKLFDISA